MNRYNLCYTKSLKVAIAFSCGSNIFLPIENWGWQSYEYIGPAKDGWAPEYLIERNRAFAYKNPNP